MEGFYVLWFDFWMLCFLCWEVETMLKLYIIVEVLDGMLCEIIVNVDGIFLL